jgi:hypothetical protein
VCDVCDVCDDSGKQYWMFALPLIRVHTSTCTQKYNYYTQHRNTDSTNAGSGTVSPCVSLHREWMRNLDAPRRT